MIKKEMILSLSKYYENLKYLDLEFKYFGIMKYNEYYSDRFINQNLSIDFISIDRNKGQIRLYNIINENFYEIDFTYNGTLDLQHLLNDNIIHENRIKLALL